MVFGGLKAQRPDVYAKLEAQMKKKGLQAELNRAAALGQLHIHCAELFLIGGGKGAVGDALDLAVETFQVEFPLDTLATSLPRTVGTVGKLGKTSVLFSTTIDSSSGHFWNAFISRVIASPMKTRFSWLHCVNAFAATVLPCEILVSVKKGQL